MDNKKMVYNIVLIGAKSTGKTVYLTSLYHILPFVRVVHKETLNYLKPLKKQFEKREIQATNAGYQELFFEYKNRYFDLSFKIDDYDGQFAEQFSTEDNQELKKKLEDNIKKAESMMFFLPYEKNLDIQKIENIKEEVDLFIEKIKELYPNKKQFPIPVVIAVTKWDNSPYFKSKNDTEKAKEYIKNNKSLENIKEKIETFFSKVMIIPISSYEKYNLEKVLEFCFTKTFELWEKKVLELQDKNFELLCFLNLIKDNIKFYKKGKYYKLYEKLEIEIYDELLDKFGIIETIEEYENFYNSLKLENGGNVIDCMLDSHKKEIIQIKEKLINEKQNKYLKIGVITIILSFILGIGIYFYQTNKNKNLLYLEILTSYKANNFSNVLNLIKEYKSKFGKEDKHYTEVIQIENDIYSKCKKNISQKLLKVNNLNSLNKQVKKVEMIENEAKKCKIELSNQQELQKLYKDYKDLIKLINHLSIKIINENLITDISLQILKIKNYKEYNEILELLNKKIESIGKEILVSNDENNISKIENLLNIISKLNIDNQYLIDKLNEKYNLLNQKLVYKSFKSDLMKLDYPKALKYIFDNYQTMFDSKNKEIKELLQKKLELYILSVIDSAPFTINNKKDLKILKEKIKIIDDILVHSIYMINYTPTMNDFLKQKYDELTTLYKKYSSGVIVHHISFKADKENNELGFKCENILSKENKFILKIDSKIYKWNEMNSCDRLKISWNISDYYNSGDYDVTIQEKESKSSYVTVNVKYKVLIFNGDGKYTSYITLSRDDIIKLINDISIDKYIGRGYHIIFGGIE